jgi:iron complex transport system substrate-binding protein
MSTTRQRRGLAAVILPAALALFVLGAVAVSGCAFDSSSGGGGSPAASASSGPITVTDGSGMSVTLERPATRIVSLAPANTEIAYAIGAGGKMVAGTSYDDYPEEAKSLPKIGDFANPNVEKIASFNPDLVLAAGGIQAGLRSKLEKLGMQVYVVDPKTYDGVTTDITNLGQLTGSTEQAQQVADTMQKAKDDVQAQVASASRPTTFVEIYSKPLMTAGGDTFIDDMITLAGGSNLGATAGSGFPTFSTEVLFKNDPDVYIADSGSMSKPGDISKRAGFATLTAVKDGHVYVIDDNLIARPGPRLAEGLQELVKMIHPEASSAP